MLEVSALSLRLTNHVRKDGGGFMGGRSLAFGITMVELLMALLILAEIATFTIPKVLSATQTNTRYAEAQEALAVITELTYNYALQNGGCFPGNLTCKFNKTTGAVQDGKVQTNWNGETSYDNFEAYLDSHLNYVEKEGVCTVSEYSCWTLPNGTTYVLIYLTQTLFRPGRYELQAHGALFLDTSIVQINASQYSSSGVDSDLARIYTYANGGAYGGYNNFRIGAGALPYVPAFASVFDLKDHPEDTCVAVSGSNCGM
jgi:type II secretory pathway pseudopilin PulG